ncbi:hypothetical protein AMTRI_Chr05g67990 [Amborella trichopoda]|uniref:RGG repeats nuclear RNA binding protein A isoform X1 n=1 Tax=Amborella trichopoda TaxID=13333 RepID=UPI0005D41F17|nr:RGG repeats nuclear RNA binding protein A isoform X1 [Amborella trichopoda]|eukprot:XP_011626785.1 RGG repeats nuclear RNA binding protein A isoform X1 [Amborella trichopoda]
MASTNPFDLLGDDDNDDPSLLLAAAQKQQQQKSDGKKGGAPATSGAPASQQAPAKLPSKPLPPSQAVREAKDDSSAGRGGGRGVGRGLGRGVGRGGGRGGGGFNREFNNNGTNTYSNGSSGGVIPSEEGDGGKPSSDRPRGGYSGPRPPYRGGRRGGFGNGVVGDSERPRRQFERRSGTGRGNETKREGAGRGNWGTPTDDGFAVQESEAVANVEEKNPTPEKQPEQEDGVDAGKEKENAVNEPEEKEPEDKEMTLEEYEKVREEKRKALLAMKPEERKVDVDKEFKSMQQLSLKKGNDDIFIKLGSDKDSNRRKDSAEKDERVKKSLSINEFLKPAEGEKYYSPGGRGRGRGRGDRGGYRGGYTGSSANVALAPSIEDPGQFPTLGGK